MNAVSRSLSPMRFYLQGLDARDEDGGGYLGRPRPRPWSAHSDTVITGVRAGKPRASSAETAPGDVGRWSEDEMDDGDSVAVEDEEGEGSSEEESEGEEDADMVDEEEGNGGRLDLEELDLFGHH